MCQQRIVVVDGLAETEARVDQQPLAADAGSDADGDPFSQVGLHFVDHVALIGRIVLHVLRLALLVHQAHCGVAAGQQRHGAVVLQRRHVVDQIDADREPGLHHRRVPRIQRQRYADVAQPFQQRQHPVHFLLDRYRRRIWPGRFAPDVEDIGAVAHQLQCMVKRLVRKRMATAVGKGIRCDIDDAHHQRTFERQREAAAVQSIHRQ